MKHLSIHTDNMQLIVLIVSKVVAGTPLLLYSGFYTGRYEFTPVDLLEKSVLYILWMEMLLVVVQQ